MKTDPQTHRRSYRDIGRQMQRHQGTHTQAGSDLLAEPVVARVEGLELLANELVQDASVDQRLPQLPDLTAVVPGVAQHALQGLDERHRGPERERERERDKRWKPRERESEMETEGGEQRERQTHRETDGNKDRKTE